MTGFHHMPTGMAGLRAVAAESSHAFPRHSHDEFGIGVMLSGGQLSASGRGQVSSGPGDVITVNPGEVHDGMPTGGTSRRWAMFYLTPDLMAGLGTGLRGRTGDVEFEAPVLQQPALSQGLARLHAAVSVNPRSTSAEALEEGLLQLLALVIRPADGKATVPLGPGLRRAKTMIDDNPAANPTLERLAIEAGLTRFQTLRAFCRATGFTPHAYLMQRRFDLARSLLATSAPLAEIAATSGYADQSHMTREFRRRYGVTPLAYRAALHPCNSVQDERPVPMA